MILYNKDSNEINDIINQRLEDLKHKEFEKRSFMNGFWECFSYFFKTGYLDKNKKEIIIGDNVKNSNNHIFKVVIKDGCLLLQSLKYPNSYTVLRIVHSDIEIIK